MVKYQIVFDSNGPFKLIFSYVGPPWEDIFSGHHLSPVFQSLLHINTPYLTEIRTHHSRVYFQRELGSRRYTAKPPRPGMSFQIICPNLIALQALFQNQLVQESRNMALPVLLHSFNYN